MKIVVAIVLMACSMGISARDETRHAGKVHEIDRSANEIVITHGYLREFDMPPMTMGFRVKDAALLDKVKPGDRVRFRAALINGVITVTEIERASKSAVAPAPR